jgi:hypothetical protein
MALIHNNAVIFPAYRMIPRRILSSLAAVSLSLTVLQPAFAATPTTDDILTELRSFDPDTMCEGRTAKDLGRCIGDVVKRLGTLRKDFSQATRTERDAWYTLHGYLGVSSEYSTELQKYLDSTKAKRTEFTELQRTLEKAFFTVRKQVLESSGTGSTTYSRRLEKTDIETATAKCAKQTDKSGLRVCMRQQLRLLDPRTRQLNITPGGARSTQE